MSPRTFRFRLFGSLGIFCCCMISVASGTSYNYGFDITKAHSTKRQSQDGIVVTEGMPAYRDGSVPVRPEIRDLQQDEDKWALYILALDMMQYTDQSDPTSWFGITSIHGVPFEAWSGVEPTPGNAQSGYCTHETILFPTWHRAYLALYEQELCSRVQFIASLYGSRLKNRFEAASSDCRIPYFDWAAVQPDDGTMLPSTMGSSPMINISGPAGAQVIENPLFTYDFKPLNPSTFFNITPWADWNSTRRAPVGTGPDALSNNSAVNQDLTNHVVQTQQRIYNLFSSYSNYTLFSNEGWAADTSQYDSLESLHDNVHAMLGGSNGHMTIVPFSAFDPAFFLHHAMVDRLLALWQVLNPNSWITPEVARTNSFTTSVGQVLDGSSALTPFYASSNGTFWTSDMLRDPAVLGYTYPEMEGISLSNMSSIAAGRPGVVSWINRLYGTFSTNSLVSKRSEHLQPHRHEMTSALRRQPASESPTSDSVISGDGLYREWIANIRVEKQALGGPFAVHLDLADQSHVGTMRTFASPPIVANMMQMGTNGQYIASTIPLTKTLVDKVHDGSLSSSMEPEVVGEYLTRNLLVTVDNFDGTSVLPTDVRGLSIKIISAVVQAPASEEHLPSWEQPDYELDFM